MKHIQKEELTVDSFIEKLKKAPGNWNIEMTDAGQIFLHHVMIGYINVYPGPKYSEMIYEDWSAFMRKLTEYQETHPELMVRRVRT